jgi:hypothetical protein
MKAVACTIGIGMLGAENALVVLQGPSVEWPRGFNILVMQESKAHAGRSNRARRFSAPLPILVATRSAYPFATSASDGVDCRCKRYRVDLKPICM